MSEPAGTAARRGAYSRRLADEICTRLADGHSLRAICADPTMPHRATVLRWLHANPDFRVLYTTAREAAADTLAEEIIAIADRATGRDDVPAIKLRMEARMWVATRLRAVPEKRGDTTPGITIAITPDDTSL
ncbi:terminase small subunit [Komagataeibacter sp. FNDCF1]|uniref:terminase small subunit-like protein n=1 Tax=Komagataeibacter sp. FNDCF1 TaxID=2878681 RepID=UPI001E551DAE|nr:terminase small subunit [Komagataeibacter sp. FNDCF1]MCE2563647.1 terminase small subunit [Komagataeibacter sp. FNDCF1]